MRLCGPAALGLVEDNKQNQWHSVMRDLGNTPALQKLVQPSQILGCTLDTHICDPDFQKVGLVNQILPNCN